MIMVVMTKKVVQYVYLTPTPGSDYMSYWLNLNITSCFSFLLVYKSAQDLNVLFSALLVL